MLGEHQVFLFYNSTKKHYVCLGLHRTRSCVTLQGEAVSAFKESISKIALDDYQKKTLLEITCARRFTVTEMLKTHCKRMI